MPCPILVLALAVPWAEPPGGPRGCVDLGPLGMVLGLAFSPDGKLLATGGKDEMVDEWKLPR